MLKKGFVISVVMAMLLSIQAYAFSADTNRLGIELNGNKINWVALVEHENIYLPLRLICENLGYEVNWSETDSKIHISKAYKDIVVDLKNFKITSPGGHNYYMGDDNFAQIVEQTTYIGKGFFEDNFNVKVTADDLNNNVIINDITSNQITINNIHEELCTDYIDITLDYPQIDGNLDKNASDKINSFFKQLAQDSKERGIKNADEMANEILEYPGEMNKWGLYLDYRIKYNQKGLLSLVFLNYQYLGGAHGLTIQSSYTFDLKTGEQIEIKDLMKNDSDYVLTFNKIVNSEINKRELYLLTPFESIKEDQVYYLTNGGVSIYFQQYEYFPYAAGIQVFTADYAVLKDKLNAKYSFLV